MALQLVEALLEVIPLSRMAFLALCSFFFILQYSRFLLRKSSSDSPGTGFGGTMVLTGAILVGVSVICTGLWNWAQGIFIGLMVWSGVWPRCSMGCRLMLDSGLSGGFRVERQGTESVHAEVHVCGPGMASSSWFSVVPTKMDSLCKSPTFVSICSISGAQETLVRGNLYWNLSDDCSALHFAGLTTRVGGILVTAVREVMDGLGWLAGFAGEFTPLVVLIIRSPAAWKTTWQHHTTWRN